MSRSANVLSVQSLKDFKVAWSTSPRRRATPRRRRHGAAPDARLARARPARLLAGADEEAAEDLMQARADLHRRQLSQQGSDAVSDADQKEALREAQRRLRLAEEKVAVVKRLIPQLHHAIDEYHSHSQPLGDHLSGGFEKSLAGMEKMIGALESYLALRAPTRRCSRRPRVRSDIRGQRDGPVRLHRRPAKALLRATLPRPKKRTASRRPRPVRWFPGEHHERSFRPAAPRVEAPERAVGHLPGRLERPRRPAISSGSTWCRLNNRPRVQ